MFIFHDKTNNEYLVATPIKKENDFDIWITHKEDFATRYTLDESFELLNNFPELRKDFSLVEVNE